MSVERAKSMLCLVLVLNGAGCSNAWSNDNAKASGIIEELQQRYASGGNSEEKDRHNQEGRIRRAGRCQAGKSVRLVSVEHWNLVRLIWTPADGIKSRHR